MKAEYLVATKVEPKAVWTVGQMVCEKVG